MAQGAEARRRDEAVMILAYVNMANTYAVRPTPTREQIEAFRKENFIHAHVGEIPDAGLEAWAVESNMVLDYLCRLALEREAFTRPEETTVPKLHPEIERQIGEFLNRATKLPVAPEDVMPLLNRCSQIIKGFEERMQPEGAAKLRWLDVDQTVEWLEWQSRMYMAGDDKMGNNLKHAADLLRRAVDDAPAMNKEPK
jgi:hypothetical protein